MLNLAHIHQHRRARSKKLQPYPHHKKSYQLLDYVVDVIMIIAPLMVVPQIYEIWVKDQVEGVSFATWSLILVTTLPLILYDMVHRVGKLAVMHTLLCAGYLIIIVGLIVKA